MQGNHAHESHARADQGSEPGKEPKARRHVLEEHLRDSNLPALSRLVWHTIAGHGTAKTGDVSKCPPSLNEIAKGAGIERRTVIDHVNHLVKEGWLLRDPGGPGRKTRYRLSCPWDPSPPLVRDSAPQVVRPDAPSKKVGAGRRTKVVRDDAPNGAGGRTNIVRGGAPYPGSPGFFQEYPGSSSVADAASLVVERLQVDEEEALRIVEKIKAKYNPGKIHLYVDTMTAEDLAKFRDTQPGRGVDTSAPLCPTCKGSRVDPDDPQKFMPCPPCDGTGRQNPANPGRHQQSQPSVPGNILFFDPPNHDDYHQKLG